MAPRRLRGRRRPRSERSADLAITLAVARQGRALVGPPPDELLDPVPATDVRAAAVSGVPALLDDLAGDTRNVLLTLARVWHTLATGAIVPKDKAAAWAAAQLPAGLRTPLLVARDLYLHTPYADEPAWDLDAAIATAARLRAEIVALWSA